MSDLNIIQMKQIENYIIALEERVINIENRYEALHRLFVGDIQEKPRSEITFIEERLRALEEMQKALNTKENTECVRTTELKIAITL